jgi:hypothetical protein
MSEPLSLTAKNQQDEVETSQSIMGYAGDGGNGDTAGMMIANVAATIDNAAVSMEDKKKRLCRFPGCNRVIKSQGHCQRHGAKTKRCRFSGCDKQAQGTHDGLCKRHWKAIHCPDAAGDSAKNEPQQPPPPSGESVYDVVLPLSIAFRPSSSSATAASVAANGSSTEHMGNELDSPANKYSGDDDTPMKVGEDTITAEDSLLLENIADDEDAFHMDGTPNHHGAVAAAASFAESIHPTPVTAPLVAERNAKLDPWDVPPPPDGVQVMPLVQFLRENSHKKAGWHRHQERRARGVFPVSSLSCQLEPWERQLALVEILLLSGGTPYANFKHLR